MPRPFYASELVGADLVWLLDLTIAGRVFRLSTEFVEVITADGESLPYDGGLVAPEPEERFDPYAQSPEEVSAALEVFLPLDAAALVAQGHKLRRGRGTLSLWIRGTTYESRHILIRSGLVVGAEWGSDGEPLRFTLTMRPWEDKSIWPPVEQTVDEATWPSSGSKAQGLSYPQVFGEPGVYIGATGTTTYAKGSPALWVASSKLLIAGHAVKAATVVIVDSAGLVESFAVAQEVDGLGHLVSTVDLIGAATITVGSGEGYWVQWRTDGAMYAKGDGIAMDGAGDILEWFLERSTLRIDYGRMSTARSKLNHLKLGGYIDTPSSPWEVVQSLLAYLPAGVRSGPEGVYIEAWTMDTSPSDVVAHIEEGPGFSRRGMPLDDDGVHASQVAVSFALDGDSNTRRKARVSHREWDADHKWRVPSPYARNSTEPDTTIEIEAAWVWDAGTAFAIATAITRARSRPGVVYEFDAGLEHAWLLPGHWVALTCSDLSLASKRLSVLSRTWSLPMMLYRLRDTGDPFTDALVLP